MSSTEATSSPAKKVSSSTKKKRTPASHPKYIDMVVGAIRGLKEAKGSSRHAIVKYIMAHYKVGDNDKYINTRVKMALKGGSADGVLKQVKGIGASGSFRITEKSKKAVAKSSEPKTVKKATKKPAASPKKSTPKKKKTASSELKKKTLSAKKTATPKKKAAAKKPTPKKTPVKKITKKSPAAKKAVKTPTKKAATKKKAAKK